MPACENAIGTRAFSDAVVSNGCLLVRDVSDPWATYRAAVVLFWIGKITPWLFALCVVADAWVLRDKGMMWVGAAIIAALAAVFVDLILRHAL